MPPPAVDSEQCEVRTRASTTPINATAWAGAADDQVRTKNAEGGGAHARACARVDANGLPYRVFTEILPNPVTVCALLDGPPCALLRMRGG